MNKFVKEAVLWAMMVLPFIYLASIWEELPDRVPTHFNLEGVADDWSNKTSLIFYTLGLELGIYLLMLFLPKFDPKKKIQQMGDKYYSFRFMLTFFFALMSSYFIHISNVGSLKDPNLLLVLLGLFFAALGNFFQAVRPNYFMGIRTPWTLQSDNVWRKTHRLAGRLWMIGGVTIGVCAFIIGNNLALLVTFSVIVAVMIVVPMVFSYSEFKKEKNATIG